MAEACREAGCALIGGETAQLPGIYRESTYDLAGFIVGSVDEKRIIDGSAIREGDIIVGLPSNGLHTNGYSLARAALGLTGDADAVRVMLDAHSPDLGEPLSDALLRPHTSYLPAVEPLLDNDAISGLAHVTGGGIVGNLSRIVPHDCTAIVDASRWTPPPVFTLIQRSGNVSTHEMFDVFNMGIGFIIVARAEAALMIEGSVEGAITIGEIAGAEPGMERVQLKGLAGA
jgi:phosphoribosylformylglycinamidine cyclo-ligase